MTSKCIVICHFFPHCGNISSVTKNYHRVYTAWSSTKVTQCTAITLALLAPGGVCWNDLRVLQGVCRQHYISHDFRPAGELLVHRMHWIYILGKVFHQLFVTTVATSLADLIPWSSLTSFPSEIFGIRHQCMPLIHADTCTKAQSNKCKFSYPYVYYSVLENAWKN